MQLYDFMRFIVYIAIFLAFFPIGYMNFYVTLSDDIEIYAGKKVLRNQRRKQKGFWKKFLFLDFCWAVERWHYVLFWIFLISYPIVALSSSLLILSNNVIFRIMKITAGFPCLLARKDVCSTILLAGTDESGDRTDTIMLLNVNRRERRISVMSIPRDTKVNSSYTPHKINGAYGVNGKNEDGMDALMDYVSDCVGFRPDGYILIDLDVFIDLVDLMGGVEFDVPCDMYYNDASQDLFINLTAGLQELDGEQAMGLVRFRSSYAMADLERVNVQRNFISAALDQWISLKNLWKLPSAARLMSANTITNLSTRNLVWLAESVAICGTDDIQMMTIPSNLSGDGMYVLVDPWEAVDTVNECFNPYETEITVDDLSPGY